jgi:hypothetical protein
MGHQPKKQESSRHGNAPGKVVPSKEAIHKVIVGQLRTTIKTHGPISAALIGSAAKRVAGGVIGYITEAGSTPDLRSEVERLRRECSEKDDVIRGLREKMGQVSPEASVS